MKNVVAIVVFLCNFHCYAQNTKAVKKPIQLSGILVEGDSLKGVPAASIKIVKTDSIDYSYFFSVPTDDKGLFLLMAKPGDVLEFKKVGYIDSRYTVPDTLTKPSKSIIQIMYSKENYRDAPLLPEVLPKR